MNEADRITDQGSGSKRQKEQAVGGAKDSISRAMERARQERQEEVLEVRPAVGELSGEERKLRSIDVSREVLQESRVLGGGEGDAEFSQAYKVLRTRVWQQMRTNDWQTLAVTSANPGEGKTLTAINLAISLAMMEIGRTVVLVDLDMRRPSVHRYFGIHPDSEISDYLVGDASLENVMLHPGVVERFVLLPGGKSLTNSSEILSSPRITRLLQELRSRFPSQLVIFDLPPVLATDDALVLAPHLDGFLLVVEDGKTHADEVSKAVDLLKDTHLLGTVLNKSEESSQYKYGYGY